MADPKDTRDLLDRRLGRLARAGRRPRGVPVPGPREPSDDVLLRVAEGSASAEERAEVAAAGPFTQERLAVLQEALAETGHTGAVERAARYVFVMAKEALSLLRAATEPVALPAAATVRSGSAGGAGNEPAACYYEFVQPFGNVEAHLKIEHVTRGAAASIDVQVRLPALVRTGTRVTLLAGGKTVDSMPVGDDGSATFSGLGRERYEIVVKQAGEDLGRVHLDFIGPS